MNKFKNLQNLKVALVYDRVNTRFGGAEQVLLVLHDLFPEATLFTSVYDKKEAQWSQVFKVKTSFLQKCRMARRRHRLFLPLMPLAFENLDLREYDLVISITSAEAKGIITQPGQKHICYLLTPPRYLYSHQQEYLNSRVLFKIPVIKFFTKKIFNYLTWWDQAAIHRPDYLIPISKLVQQRVKKYYNLTTLDPIYPPIDVNLEQPIENWEQLKNLLRLPEKFYLVVSRLVAYKKIDLAIQACKKMKKNLIIVGNGPEYKHLVKLADNNKHIFFLNNQSQKIVNTLMKQAKLFIAPGIDDFGLSPIQANFFGTPAVINHHSGVAEVLQHKKQALHLNEISLAELINKIKMAEQIKFNSAELKQNALKYTKEKFKLNFTKALKMVL